MRMKLLKYLCSVFLCLNLIGCQNSSTIESTAPFDIHFFYSETCHYCEDLKSNLIPKIKEEFENQVTIYEHEIDDEESKKLYDEYLGVYDEQIDSVIPGKLKGVTTDFVDGERYVPVLIIGDYYGFMGYDSNFDDDYIEDIHLARQNKDLSPKMAEGRWLFND